MGNFLDDIKQVKQEQDQSKQSVIDQIVTYFDNQINSSSFEEKLKERIIRDIKSNHSTPFVVEYWRYHEGCSPTHFGISCCKDFYGDKGNYHNGVDLFYIKKDVIEKLCELCEKKFNELGLHYVASYAPNSLDYPEYRFEFFV